MQNAHDSGDQKRSSDLERRGADLDQSPDPGTPKLPEEADQAIGGVFAAEYRSHSGPLPSKEWLAEVEALHPGSTEIILKDFADERQHQRFMQMKAMDLDSRVVQDFTRYQMQRLWMAGALALFLATAGIALILLDKEIYGFVLLIAEVAGLLGVFFANRDSDEDLDELLAEIEREEEAAGADEPAE